MATQADNTTAAVIEEKDKDVQLTEKNLGRRGLLYNCSLQYNPEVRCHCGALESFAE